MDFLTIFISLCVLIILEVILGIDNVIFLSILTEKLPKNDRLKARRWGLTLAWVMRLGFLALALQLVHLTRPLFALWDMHFSARDLFLVTGGIFLICKATQEIHNEVSQTDLGGFETTLKLPKFKYVIVQIALMDIIFSLDSILTAVGLTRDFYVMATAITCAILVMLYASEPVSQFVKKYPTIKMLALSFLILIGMVLVADGFAFHIPRAYVYFAMGFSLSVETLNLIRQARRIRRR